MRTSGPRPSRFDWNWLFAVFSHLRCPSLLVGFKYFHGLSALFLPRLKPKIWDLLYKASPSLFMSSTIPVFWSALPKCWFFITNILTYRYFFRFIIYYFKAWNEMDLSNIIMPCWPHFIWVSFYNFKIFIFLS